MASSRPPAQPKLVTQVGVPWGASIVVAFLTSQCARPLIFSSRLCAMQAMRRFLAAAEPPGSRVMFSIIPYQVNGQHRAADDAQQGRQVWHQMCRAPWLRVRAADLLPGVSLRHKDDDAHALCLFRSEQMRLLRPKKLRSWLLVISCRAEST